nr:MAG TPA: hypothetical protein [Bacteriophage sp.]
MILRCVILVPVYFVCVLLILWCVIIGVNLWCYLDIVVGARCE